MITPAIKTDNIINFLNEHIRHDLLLIGKTFMKNGEETKLLLHLLLKFLLCDENKTGKFALIYRMSQKNVSAIFGMSIIIQFMHNYIVYPKWGLLHFLLVLNVIEKIFLVKLFIDEVLKKGKVLKNGDIRKELEGDENFPLVQ